MAATNAEPQDVLNFWLKDVGPAGWYNSSDALDAEIRSRFEGLWSEAEAGKLNHWLTNPTDALAFLIVTDQFPRNMFRDTGKAFASDRIALAAAKLGIEKGWDMRVEAPERQFFYLPLMHSENLSRSFTAQETSYIDEGGYGRTVKQLRENLQAA